MIFYLSLAFFAGVFSAQIFCGKKQKPVTYFTATLGLPRRTHLHPVTKECWWFNSNADCWALRCTPNVSALGVYTHWAPYNALPNPLCE